MDELKERLDERQKEIEASELSQPGCSATDCKSPTDSPDANPNDSAKNPTKASIVYKEFNPETHKFVEISKEERDRKEALL